MACAPDTLKQSFVTEGYFVAFPLCLPDETYPIPPDESRISALVQTVDGLRVYGATGGERCHVFVGRHKGAAGGIVDLGVVPDATNVPCVMCLHSEGDTDRVLAGVNEACGFTFARFTGRFPGDTIQEPGFPLPEFERVAEVQPGVLHDAVYCADQVWCLTDTGVFMLDPATATYARVAATQQATDGSAHRLVRVGDGGLCWFDLSGLLHHLRLGPAEHMPSTFCVPGGARRVAVCPWGDTLVCADQNGMLHGVELASMASRELVQLPLPDVQCMTALPDGRLYGMYGSGIGRLFKADLRTGTASDLGAVVAVIGSKRYGFEFSCAITGSEGEVYLGESDRGGQLWLYWPPHSGFASGTTPEPS